MLIFIGYSLNKDFITKTYCINKDKPKMHCNGKCHLAKELKDHEQSESAPVNSSKDKVETVVYLSTNITIAILNNNDSQQIATPYLERSLADYSSLPFQPPRV